MIRIIIIIVIIYIYIYTHIYDNYLHPTRVARFHRVFFPGRWFWEVSVMMGAPPVSRTMTKVLHFDGLTQSGSE